MSGSRSGNVIVTTDGTEYIEREDGQRILGLGVGTFISVVMILIAFALSAVGRGTNMRLLMNTIGIVLVGATILFLWLVPRESAFEPVVDTGADVSTSCSISNY